jgi:hypothetical protein
MLLFTPMATIHLWHVTYIIVSGDLSISNRFEIHTWHIVYWKMVIDEHNIKKNGKKWALGPQNVSPRSKN